MIRRPPRSTQSRSSAASDVYKRQVDQRLAEQPATNRPGRDLHERVLVPVDDAGDHQGHHPEQHEDEEGAEQAELLTDDREDEVVVRLRQVRPFFPARAQTKPPPAARGETPDPMLGLVARGGDIAVAAQPRGDPAGMVLAGIYEPPYEQPRTPTHDNEHPDRDPGNEQRPGNNQQQDKS